MFLGLGVFVGSVLASVLIGVAAAPYAIAGLSGFNVYLRLDSGDPIESTLAVLALVHTGVATIELATPEHARAIDRVEGAPPASGPTLRIALEVDDTPAALALAEEAGMATIAPPVETPFRSINARIQGPAGWQVTWFQELETLEQRTAREGFTTDDRR